MLRQAQRRRFVIPHEHRHECPWPPCLRSSESIRQRRSSAGSHANLSPPGVEFARG